MSEPRRLAFVTPRYADRRAVGGAETAVRLLAEHAAARGHSVELLTTCAVDHVTWKNERRPGSVRRNGITVRFFPTRVDRDLSTYLRIQRKIDLGLELTDEEEETWIGESVHSDDLYAYLRRNLDRFDAFLFAPYLFGTTMRGVTLTGRKSVLIPCLHDEPFARLRITRRLFEEAGWVMFHTRPERELAERICGADPARASVVGIGFDPFPADGPRFRKQYAIDGPLMLYCGRREGGKNVPLLIDYFTTWAERNDGDTRLALAGSGAVAIPSNMAGRIIDLDYLQEQEKRDAMAAADVLVQPSVNESLSIVLMEGWLAGTAALVHAGCAVTRDHCIRSNGGLFFADYPEFEECANRLIGDPALREALARGGQRYVREEYSWDRVMDRFEESLEARDV